MNYAPQRRSWFDHCGQPLGQKALWEVTSGISLIKEYGDWSYVDGCTMSGATLVIGEIEVRIHYYQALAERRTGLMVSA